MADADGALEGHSWFRQLGRRLVAEAALTDGWGEPVGWLREALQYFGGRGDERIASACRSLLRQAGAAVSRRRGDTAVPGELRALGVTGRELEVLRLLGVGLPNREIAASSTSAAACTGASTPSRHRAPVSRCRRSPTSIPASGPRGWRCSAMFVHHALSPWVGLVDRQRYAAEVERVRSMGMTTIATAHSPLISPADVGRAFALLRDLPDAAVPPPPGQDVVEAVLSARV
jgi:hypothetical protein